MAAHTDPRASADTPCISRSTAVSWASEQALPATLKLALIGIADGRTATPQAVAVFCNIDAAAARYVLEQLLDRGYLALYGDRVDVSVPEGYA